MNASRYPFSMIGVFLISDSLIVLSGLEKIIGAEPETFLLCGSAATSERAAKTPELSDAGVILLDMDPLGDQVQQAVSRLVAVSQAKIVLLNRLNATSQQDLAVVAGARGVIKHDLSPDMLLTALKKVHEGQLWLDRDATGRIFVELSRLVSNKATNPGTQQISSLTDREHRIVACIAEHSGETAKAIAKKLNISESTLRNHLTSIYGKLGVANRHGLVAYAFKNGLSSPAV